MFFAKTILYMSASLAIGYWVLTKANKEEVSKTIGKITAWIIIVAAVIGLLCGIANHARKGLSCGPGSRMRHGKSMSMGMGMKGCGSGKCPHCSKDVKIKGCFGGKADLEKAK